VCFDRPASGRCAPPVARGRRRACPITRRPLQIERGGVRMARTVTDDGVEIDYVSRGRGKPILFIHGWLCSQRVWDCQFHALRDRYRCVALDLRGMGSSEKADCRYSFEEFGADIRHLIKKLGLSDVTLVGWSMGVSVTLAYMNAYQDDGDVGRIVLLNGPIKLISSADWQFGIEEKECMGYIDALAEDPLNGRWSFAQANLYRPSQAETTFLYTLSLQTPLDIALEAVYHQMKLDHRPVLKSLRVPCLAMQSDHDFYPVALGHYIADTVPRGRVKVFDDCGHSVHFQNAARFNDALIEFIEST
jgi:pimeloyl-ACP methyl ester carboxylesterase